MSEHDVSTDVEGDDASHRLNEGLKSCQSMMNNYREMIGRAVDDSYRQQADDSQSGSIEN